MKHSVQLSLHRRHLLQSAAALALTSCSQAPKKSVASPAASSAVAILKASSYETELLSRLEEGMRAVWPNAASQLRGKRILLKPNLVEFDERTAINTDPRFVLAARELFLKLGAASVLIGEGPGHRRDTWDLADQAGYRKIFSDFDNNFVDLNLDDLAPRRAFGDSMDLYLSRTVLEADLVVSLAKMKTHHWAGATLSMKNFFGLVPGSVYGWPKNLLHHQGIDRSIVELNRIVRHSFAIIDGIVGMEGNGPIQGTPVNMGVIVMGRDLPAVDSTCARLMQLDPHQMIYLRDADAIGLGQINEASVEQRAETIQALARPFAVVDRFSHLRPAS